MIDYTQHGFTHPAFVLDPIPSVAEYLDDYEARNEAWYRSFAFPLEGGGYGARPSSFERRGLPPDAAPSQVAPDAPLPPIIQPRGPAEDRRVMPGDLPEIELRDVAGMTDEELRAETRFLAGPGEWIGRVASAAAPPPVSWLMSAMSGEGLDDRFSDVIFESLGRAGGNVEARMGGGSIPLGSDLGSMAPDLPSLFDQPSRETGGHQQSRGSAPAGLTGGWDDETGFGGA